MISSVPSSSEIVKDTTIFFARNKCCLNSQFLQLSDASPISILFKKIFPDLSKPGSGAGTLNLI